MLAVLAAVLTCASPLVDGGSSCVLPGTCSEGFLLDPAGRCARWSDESAPPPPRFAGAGLSWGTDAVVLLTSETDPFEAPPALRTLVMAWPRGLVGEQIPFGGRVIALADTFDAMTSDRAYRKGLPKEVAIAEIQKCRGTQFFPDLADRFCVTLAREELPKTTEDVLERARGT